MCSVSSMRFLRRRKLINIRRSGVSFFSDYVENPAKTMYTETELEQLSPNICLIYVQSEILNYISVKQAFQMIFRIMCFLLLRNLRMEIKFKIELNPFLTQVFKKFSLKRLHGLSLTVRSIDCTPLELRRLSFAGFQIGSFGDTDDGGRKLRRTATCTLTDCLSVSQNLGL